MSVRGVPERQWSRGPLTLKYAILSFGLIIVGRLAGIKTGCVRLLYGVSASNISHNFLSLSVEDLTQLFRRPDGLSFRWIHQML
jgi:hypothetical protein